MAINGTYILEKNGENFDKLLEAWGVPGEVIVKVMASKRRMRLEVEEGQVTVHSEFTALGCDFDSSRRPVTYTIKFDQESVISVLGVEMKINQKLGSSNITGSAALSGKEMTTEYHFSDDGFTFTGSCDSISAKTFFKRQ